MLLMDPGSFTRSASVTPRTVGPNIAPTALASPFLARMGHTSLPSWVHWSNGSLFGNF